jgi:hypothetical protein
VGAVESNASEIAKGVPLGVVDPKRFDTLRYRYMGEIAIGKTMSDLSRTHGRFTARSKVWVHRFMDWCRPPWYTGGDLLRIHHYIGSWESYSFRNDCRKGGIKNRQIWEKESSMKRECNLLTSSVDRQFSHRSNLWLFFLRVSERQWLHGRGSALDSGICPALW